MASEWFYTRDGKSKSGPVSSAQLQALAKSGGLHPTDKVLKTGTEQWVSASTVKGLFPSSVEAVTARKPPVVASTAPYTNRSAIGIVAAVAVACFACLGGVIVLGAVIFLNSGAPDKTLAENKRKQPAPVVEEKTSAPPIKQSTEKDKGTEGNEILPIAKQCQKAPPPKSLWKADSVRGVALLLEGVQFAKNGQADLAIKSFETAISIDWDNSDPSKQPYYLRRAQAYEMKGDLGPKKSLDAYNEADKNRQAKDFQACIKCYQNSMALDPAYPWAPNNLAWLYATCDDAGVRNGTKAIQYATIACELSEWHCWSFIDTLSAAYAEAGDFECAVIYAERALTLAPLENQEEARETINRFRAKKP